MSAGMKFRLVESPVRRRSRGLRKLAALRTHVADIAETIPAGIEDADTLRRRLAEVLLEMAEIEDILSFFVEGDGV